MIRTLQPRVQPYVRALLAGLARQGIRARITSARRDPAKQAKLYRDWKAGRSRFPAAPPGRSTHALGIAFDVIFNDVIPPSRPPYPFPYPQVGELWERMGVTWGGRFNDPIHFDFRPRRG